MEATDDIVAVALVLHATGAVMGRDSAAYRMLRRAMKTEAHADWCIATEVFALLDEAAKASIRSRALADAAATCCDQDIDAVSPPPLM